ncbi:MAG TPA: hypothetical protein VNS29_15265 [Burkholderiaceae bacterium]|nr:hypothetical protein [Burkholderiaceae bacterium]
MARPKKIQVPGASQPVVNDNSGDPGAADQKPLEEPGSVPGAESIAEIEARIRAEVEAQVRQELMAKAKGMPADQEAAPVRHGRYSTMRASEVDPTTLTAPVLTADGYVMPRAKGE